MLEPRVCTTKLARYRIRKQPVFVSFSFYCMLIAHASENELLLAISHLTRQVWTEIDFVSLDVSW